MSAIELWNVAAERWWSWVVQAVLASSLLFVLVTLVWLVIRRRASAHLGHVLFLVPLAPLVLPSLGSCELPIPLGSLRESDEEQASLPRPEPMSVPAVERLETPSSHFPGAGATPSVEPATTPTAAPVRPSRRAWLAAAWLVSVLALLLRFAIAQHRTNRLLRSATELGGDVGEHLRAHLARLAQRFGLRHDLRVVESDVIPAPSIWGTRRPVLVFDRALVERLDADQLGWVLSHELAHLTRRDWIRGALQRCVQLAWFFHPLVWITGRIANELREAACDESALARNAGATRKSCAAALIQVAARSLPDSPRALLLSLQHDKIQMKKRILRILDPARVPARGSSLAGLLVCGLLAGSSVVQWSFAQDGPAAATGGETDERAIPEREIRRSIRLAIEWLIAQQHEDGHWSTGPETEAAAGNFNSIGVTGFVLLALEREASTGEPARISDSIARGRDYLARIQRDDGLFGEEVGSTFMQSHAIATLAWLKTRPRGDERAWRLAAERAVGIIRRARNPHQGWRFELLPIGENDSFTTGLMMAALKEARDAGIEVPDRDRSEPLAYIDGLTDPVTGRTGYESKGGDDARLWIKRHGYPVELTQLSTAVAISTRIDWGQDPRRSEVLRRGAFLLTDSAPRWDVEAGSIDYYYWMFGTRALASVDGLLFDHWRDALVEALVPNQMRDDDGGWWPAIDAWTPEEESVHSTVMCTLALQYTL